MELTWRVYTSERTTVSGGRDRTARKRKCETRQKQNKSKDKRTGLKTRHYNAGAENGTFYPIDRLRTGERKFTGYGAEVFAHGIPPDVCSDFFDGIGRAKNVVVVTHLPEGGATELSKLKGGPLLEEADKLAEIRSVVRAFGERNMREEERNGGRSIREEFA